MKSEDHAATRTEPHSGCSMVRVYLSAVLSQMDFDPGPVHAGSVNPHPSHHTSLQLLGKLCVMWLAWLTYVCGVRAASTMCSCSSCAGQRSTNPRIFTAGVRAASTACSCSLVRRTTQHPHILLMWARTSRTQLYAEHTCDCGIFSKTWT